MELREISNVSSTTPNDEPVVGIHMSPTGSLPRSLDLAHTAPEADREALEGLQVDLNGPYPGPTVAHEEKQWWPYDMGSQKAVYRDDAGLIPCEHKATEKEQKIWGFKRKTFVILVAMMVIIILCVAIGGGVGGYFANKSKDSSNNTSQETARPTATILPPDDDDPTSTEIPVSAGITGMAARPCEAAFVAGPPGTPQATPHVENPFNAHGATFQITCRRGIPDDDVVGSLDSFIEYTLMSCMNRCADTPACMGVVYGANLTDMVADKQLGANCLLKNETWSPSKVVEKWKASAVKI